ncbi:SusC/RagA family TonB-linked outer membrane protein [Paludibacteraceae bacterium OttesenSCG-928-F17]|nr:SusC/RagA family TonB-linked outer membrane protein [Paludibacteraceae bacterium OttesenSCG-928-F17]
MKKLTLVFLYLCACIGFVHAQEMSIRGTVVDDTREPIIGATVMVKGTTTGTVTDFDGNFQLNVPSGSTITFSYVGMQTQELKAQSVMNVTMKSDAIELEDFVVTGYQKIDRKMFTGAAAVVKGEDVKVDGATDVSRMLQGKAAGVQMTNVSGTFGAAPKLRVRGNPSILGSGKPLWVVDGVVLDDVEDISADDLSSGNAATLISSAVSGINADDIETFQILKDASATALYGARAMNGVIVITTKKGKKNATAQINYTGEFTLRMKPSYSQYDIMNSQEQMDVFLEMQDKGHLNPSNMYMAQDGGVFNKMYRLIDQYNGGGYGLANTAQAKYQYLRDGEQRNTDWFDVLFRNTVQQNHSVSIASGGDRASTYTSLSFFNDPGWTDVDKVNRFTFNSNTSYQFSDKFTFNVLGSASYRKQNAPGTLNRSVNVVDGEYSRDFDINPFSYALNSSRTMSSEEYYRRNYADFNIIDEMKNNYMELDMLDTKMQIDLSIKPMKGLDISVLGSMRYVKSTREHRILDNSNMANAYRAAETSTIISSNNFLWKDPDNPDALPVVVMSDGGFYNTYDNNLLSYYGRASANYNLVKEDHAINALAGAEIRSTDRLIRYNNGYGYLWGSEMAVTDYRIIRKIIDAGTDYFGMSQLYDRSVGFFGTATYSYRGTYTLNGTLRTEGTNQMGASRTARWLPTWNVSGSWNAFNEPWMESTHSVLSMLTLRGTYGLTATMFPGINSGVVYYAQTVFRPFQEDRETGYYISNLENKELTWEKMKELNIGLDFGFLKNRISVTSDIYWRNSFDLIGVINTSGMGGASRKYANYADMKSNGIEFTLNTVNIKNKNFTWTNNFTFSYNQSKITNLDYRPRVINMVEASGAPKEGYPTRGLFSIPFAGLDENGHPTFYNEDGEVVYYLNLQNTANTDYLKYEGPVDPKFIGGFENSLTYKNFKLDLYFTYQFGNKIRLHPTFKSSYSDLDAMTKDMRNRWTVPGDETVTNIPVIASTYQLRHNSNLSYAYNAYNWSDERVAKGDFIRLKDITLTYTFDKKITDAMKIRSLQLRGIASNVWLIYSDKALNGQDPEFTRAGGVAMPTPRQFTLSVRIGF